jgi:hypothetical protein
MIWFPVYDLGYEWRGNKLLDVGDIWILNRFVIFLIEFSISFYDLRS